MDDHRQDQGTECGLQVAGPGYGRYGLGGNQQKWFYRLDLKNGVKPGLAHKQFGAGLNDLSWNYVFPTAREPRFTSKNHVYEFSRKKGEFVEIPGLKSVLRDSVNSAPFFVEDSARNWWFANPLGILWQMPNGNTEWDSLSLMPIQRKRYSIYPEKTGIVSVGNDEGLYRYDGIQMAMHPSYPVLIREVRLLLNDSLLNISGQDLNHAAVLKTPLPCNLRDLSFRFAATSYVGETGNEFRYKPLAELEILREYALKGDIQGILDSLDQIEAHYPETIGYVKQMRKWAGEFDMGRIRGELAGRNGSSKNLYYNE